jgi:hypothetical protein
MPAARHNLTRRAVLGAAFAAPAVLVSAAAPDPAMTRRWNRALAALRRAKAAEKAFRDGPMAAADRVWHAVRARWPRDYDFEADPDARAAVHAAFAACAPWEERLNDFEAAHFAAIKRLLRTPAPDLPALARKIELAVDYEIAELTGGAQCMAALKADAWTLARASPN